MSTQNEHIQQLHELTWWYPSLSNNTLEASWLSPIKEGKWSTAEIIAHLLRWDEYLITELIPTTIRTGEVHFPDHDGYNAQSAAYARSGISQTSLLQQAVDVRNKLVLQLSEMTEQ